MLEKYQKMFNEVFELLNKEYFEGTLPPLVITIQSSNRKSYGHFSVFKVWKAEGVYMHELNISSDFLSRSIYELCSTMQHELIHYFCQINGIQDTSQGGRYHNKRFKEEAEKRGLLISQGQYIGWSVTTPSKAFVEFIDSHKIQKPMEINRDGERFAFIGIGGSTDKTKGTDNGIELPKKPKCSTRKYQCPCCKNSFRATKDINVLCMDCNVQYEKIEKVDNSEV